MNKRIFYWFPRVLAILYILFLALFALDVFIPGKDFLYYIVALFMHLIPNFVLLTILTIAWKHERIGGALFLVAFAVLFSMFWDRSFLWLQLLLFSPLVLIGILFLLQRKEVGKK